MGTNYYFVESDVCPHCGRYDNSAEKHHIGKSSAGWCFGLRVHPHDGINTLEDWARLFASGIIEDEYGNVIPAGQMIDIIENRSWPTPPTEPRRKLNDAELGPNNLLRHKIDGHCIGHGPGTYDYIQGEFS